MLLFSCRLRFQLEADQGDLDNLIIHRLVQYLDRLLNPNYVLMKNMMITILVGMKVVCMVSTISRDTNPGFLKRAGTPRC